MYGKELEDEFGVYDEDANLCSVAVYISCFAVKMGRDLNSLSLVI